MKILRRAGAASSPAAVVVLAVLAAIVLMGTAAAALARSGLDGGSEAGGVYGEAVYRRVNVSEINAQLDPGLPGLPETAWALGWGAFGGSLQFQFRAGSARATFESSGPSGELSRLTFEDTRVGLLWRVLGGGRVRLLGGGAMGLSQVRLEVYRTRPTSLDEATGVHWSRYMLLLEPQLTLQFMAGDSAALELSAGYPLATDFWNAQWGNVTGGTVPGSPAAFTGPNVRLSLLLGTL